jgi:SAM-dependent methyltransferase
VIPDKYRLWNEQIELFAKYFLCNARLNIAIKFTLLDFGCGTGSALRLIKERFPESKLFGCDIEQSLINIAKEQFQKYAEFSVMDFFAINKKYDYIYVSNVLEHLEDWEEALNHLLNHAEAIYILVPFRELINSDITLSSGDTSIHRHSFNKESFYRFTQKPHEIYVKTRIIRTPWAWGPGPIASLRHLFDPEHNKQELLVCIYKDKVLRPFKRHPLSIFLAYLNVIIPYYLRKYLK